MIVCDRCGKKIIKITDKTQRTLNIYSAPAASIGHNVDLCNECNTKYENYMQKAESFFMVNLDYEEAPIRIFDDVRYWGTPEGQKVEVIKNKEVNNE